VVGGARIPPYDLTLPLTMLSHNLLSPSSSNDSLGCLVEGEGREGYEEDEGIGVAEREEEELGWW